MCTDGSGVFGADASDVIGSRTYIYAPCQGGTVGMRVTTDPLRLTRIWKISSGGANGSPLIAGGLLWVLSWSGGGLYAVNPSTGHVDFYRATDPLGHFVTPSVGDGQLFVPVAGSGSGRGGVEAFRTVG